MNPSQGFLPPVVSKKVKITAKIIETHYTNWNKKLTSNILAILDTHKLRGKYMYKKMMFLSIWNRTNHCVAA